jgi:peptidoglycan-associated lipoprotein
MSVPRITATAAVLLACSHAPPPAPPAAQQTAQPAAPPSPPAPPATPSKPVEAAQPVQAPVQQASIYFAFDSSTLSPEARTTLQSFSDAMQKRPDLRVRIEGSCDERGTVEYNLALGQRRADAAKKYLVNLGLVASRITAISNGKEKPRDSGHDERAWQENRRDDLLPSNNALGQL